MTDMFTHPSDLDVVPEGVKWQSITDADRREVTAVIRPNSSTKAAKDEIADQAGAHSLRANTANFDDVDQIYLVETHVLGSEKSVSGVDHPEGTWVMRFQVPDDDLWEFFTAELAPSNSEAQKLIGEMDAWEKVTLPAQTSSAPSPSGDHTSVESISVWERWTQVTE